ncbi:MAG: MOSC domain-containing protein [Leisingera sp.]
MRNATILHIHTTSGSGRPMKAHQSIRALAGEGLEGDRYAVGKGKFSCSPGVREVTLFEAETLRFLEAQHGIRLDPHEHRRNLTTEGVALDQLSGQIFSIGEAVFEGLRPCAPCRYLNIMSRKQVSARLTGQAGLICKVVRSGTIAVSDQIALS